MYDWLIVGAGLSGAVVAERLAKLGDKRVLVIDQRDHVGGNAFDFVHDSGIAVHRYGPHIFHTNAAAIFDYLSEFTEWTPYEHRVRALVDGRLVPVPFNFTSIDILFEPDVSEKYKEALLAAYRYGDRVPISKLMTSKSDLIQKLALFIFDNVFVKYTRKQWAMEPAELLPSVMARVPINISYDDRYFADRFQGLPKKGYTSLVNNILRDPRIDLQLMCSFSEIERGIYKRIYFSGEIDEYFNCCFGELPYRSLNLVLDVYQQSRHQVVAQINYPNDGKFTRITEMAHMFGQVIDKTVVVTEYPIAHNRGRTTPYYPVPTKTNMELYNAYLSLAQREAPEVIFGGRLGSYQYINMDQAVGAALSVAKRILAGD